MPIQKLKNMLVFTGLTVGVPVVRAHGLYWNPSLKVIPDICLLDQGGYTVTATDTNVTITRTTGPADVNMLVESWHTIERAFGASSTKHLTPQPIIIQGTGTGGSGSSVQAFNVALPPGTPNINDITIAIPTAMADANYAVSLTLNIADVNNEYGVWVLAASKAAGSFHIAIGATPTNGDSVDVIVTAYS